MKWKDIYKLSLKVDEHYRDNIKYVIMKIESYINSEIYLLRKNEGTVRFTLIPTIELSITRRKEYGWWIDIHFKFLIITLNTRIYLNQTWEKIQWHLNYKRLASTREEGAQNTKLTWKQWLNLDVK